MRCLVAKAIVPNNIKGTELTKETKIAITNKIEEIANGDITKYNIMVNYLYNDNFLRTLKNKFNTNNINEININDLGKRIEDYYKNRNARVDNTISKQIATLSVGFSSPTAKTLAENYCAVNLRDIYLEEMSKPKSDRLSRQSMIKELYNRIYKTYRTNVVNIIANKIKNNEIIISNERQQSIIDNIKNYTDEFNQIKAELKTLVDKRNNNNKLLAKQPNNKIVIATIEKLNQQISELTNRANTIKDGLLATEIDNLVIEFGNVQQKNFGNIIISFKSKSKDWVNDILENSRLVDIVHEFDNVVIEDDVFDIDSEDENSVVNDDSHDRDMTTNNWEDSATVNPFKKISKTIKFELDNIYFLNNPVFKETDSINYTIDNELGVPELMGYKYVTTQLIFGTDTSSVDAFINSIFTLAQKNKDLYGISVLGIKCKQDRVFANELFTYVNKPKANKSMINLSDVDINMRQSNTNIDPYSTLLFRFMNAIKYNAPYSYNETYSKNINELIKRLVDNKKAFERNELISDKEIIVKDKTKFIGLANLLYKYISNFYPNIDIKSLSNYFTAINIKANNDQINEAYDEAINFLGYVGALYDSAKKVVESKNEYDSIYKDRLKEWDDVKKKDKNNNIPRPIYDVSQIKYNLLDESIINITQQLYKYSVVMPDINSTNAENNLSSDIVKHTFVTDFFNRLNYGTEENPTIGLEKLKEFLTQGNQLKYSPIIYGLTNSKGEKVDGLFQRDKNGKVVVNPNAKTYFNYSLFDGIKDTPNGLSALYSTMTKSDYFMSQIIAFFNPIKFNGNKSLGDNSKFAGFFMRPPSDAPRNIVIQAPKYSISNLFNNDKTDVDNYYNNFIKSIINSVNYKLLQERENNSIHTTAINNLLKNKKKYFKNKIDVNTLLEYINGNISSIKLNNISYVTQGNEIIIPFIYKQDGDIYNELYVRGKLNEFDKTEIVDLQVDTFYGVNNNIFTQQAKNELINDITNKGIIEGKIKRTVNRDNFIYIAAANHLMGELNNFVENINNVTTYENGEFKIKTSTKGLIDRYHFKDGKILTSDNKFAGSVFDFIRLFDIEGISGKELINDLSLYGDVNKSSIIKDGKINLERTDIFIVNGDRLELNELAVKDAVNNITEKWVDALIKYIDVNVEQYKTTIEGKYSISQIEEAIANGVLMSINFDDLFEGDGKLYKKPQDFFKRAKETQAGGDVYSSYDYAQNINGTLETSKTQEGVEEIIKVKQNTYTNDTKVSALSEYLIPTYSQGIIKQMPISKRNGFRAITINNSSSSYDRANEMEEELFEINKNKFINSGLPEAKSIEMARKIAKETADGFRKNVAVNDAQSFITFDEWIRRRYLDGTINQYQDIIADILDDNIKPEEIDISKINKLIQVDKNFYYDRQYDKDLKIFYSRQVKNAEFVLIPKLLPEGSSLRTLHDIMKRNDISQVNTLETSKVANKDILTFWNNDETINENFEQELNGYGNIDFTAEDAPIPVYTGVETYYYEHLHKQQEVPEHMKDKTNKAGIQIMKKMQDNVDFSDPTIAEHINKFIKNYIANIKLDHDLLIHSMGWKVENGRYVNLDGTPILDLSEFMDKAKREAQRLGLDSNIEDYFTLDSFGNTVMPTSMNNVSSTLESIAMSIINSAITRQKLPGWHGAQVTSVGYSKKLKFHPAIYKLKEPVEGLKDNIEFSEYDSLDEETKEKYNKIQESYAEVYLPRWSKLLPQNLTPEEEAKLIKQLEEEGLDIHIGYRMPTEGKQSVSILKVVGFVNDIYGSTIIVPNEWVRQTGSDFDVDSVYGICYEMYKDKEGNIRKVKFDTSNDENSIRRRYVYYVNNYLDSSVKKDEETTNNISNKHKEFYNVLNKVEEQTKATAEWKELTSKINEKFKELPINVKKEIFDIRTTKYKSKPENNTEANIQLINEYTEYESIYRNKLDNYQYTLNAIEKGEIKDEDGSTKKNIEKNTKVIEELIELGKSVIDVANINISNPYEYIDIKSKRKELKELIENAKEDYFNKIQTVANELGLYSFEEFKKLPIEEQNSKRARNNQILDAFIAIMNHTSSREENYARSNFDALTEDKNYIDFIRGAKKADISIYNPFTHLEFMNNAMSGRRLKGASVSRDNFNSINNRMHTELSEEHSITVAYDLNEYKRDENGKIVYEEVEVTKGKKVTRENRPVRRYDINLIKAAYADSIVYEDANTIIVKHKQMGWSSNNRNVLGRLITVYSSQTTAHILDAVKEGTIFNENEYTFGVFKTLVDLGIDYNTAIAFLVQPGVSEIVNIYNENNSIYTNNNINVIDVAIKNIAIKAGIKINGKPINQYTNINLVKEAISNDVRIIASLENLFAGSYNANKSVFEQSYILSGKLLQDRLKSVKNANNFENISEDSAFNDTISELAFDLAMIINFKKFKITNNNIERIARCTNPDKFGAKENVFTTRKVLKDVIEYSKLDKDNNPVGYTLVINGEPMLTKLYPDVENGIDINKSLYPSIAAFLKYATIPSVNIVSQMFILEGSDFNNLVNNIQNKLGITFNAEQYKELKQYFVAYTYTTLPYLASPITINKEGYITIDNIRIEENIKNNINPYDKERLRLFGSDFSIFNIKINDVNNPTIEEINNFNKLTPLQKVQFIQNHFNDINLFKYLNLINYDNITTDGINKQIIKFTEDNYDNEKIYNEFRNAFFNDNSLARITAIDLIKYSFIVENFRFKKGGISKIVPNDTMLLPMEFKGFDIIDNFNTMLKYNIDYNNSDNTEFVDMFIRSHSNFIKTIKIPRDNKDIIHKQFKSALQPDSMRFIPFTKSYSELLSRINFTEEIINDKDMLSNTPRYIKLEYGDKKTKNITLYEVHTIPNVGVYLLPLNKLDDNEISAYSANNANNNYNTIEYYRAIVDAARKYNKENETKIGSVKDIKQTKEFKEVAKDVVKNVKDVTVEKILNNPKNNPYYIENIVGRDTSINNLIDNIFDSYINSPVSKNIYYFACESYKLNNAFKDGIPYIQILNKDDVDYKFRITKVNDKVRKSIKKLIDNNKATDTYGPLVGFINNTKITNPIIYKIERIIDTEVQNELLNTDNVIKEAKGTLLDDINLDIDVVQTDDNKVCEEIIEDILNSRKYEYANLSYEFMQRAESYGLNIRDSISIHNNNKNIYSLGANYYKEVANIILNDINNFVTADHISYKIDNPKLYEYLVEHPDEFNRLGDLVLRANNFGKIIRDIFNIEITSDDTETKTAINIIKNSINSVINNELLKKANKLIFTDYFSSFSNNPLVKNGLIDVLTEFGDATRFDKMLSDVTELNNKTVQVISKQAYSIVYAAKKDGEIAAREFKNKLKELGITQKDFDAIIDKNGRLIPRFNDNYIKEKEELDNKLTEIANNPNKGIYTLEYLEAKLKRDKWYTENVHRKYKKEYYQDKDELLEYILNNDLGNIYLDYIKLTDEIYYSDNTLSIEDEVKRKKELNDKRKELLSYIDNDGNIKDNITITRINKFKHYLNKRKSINNKYYDTINDVSLEDLLQYHLNIIENYDVRNPDKTLEEKLQDNNYKESYDWVNDNAIITLKKEYADELADAYSKIHTKPSETSLLIRQYLINRNLIDENGDIDYNRLTNQNLLDIKAITIRNFSVDEKGNTLDNRLIKINNSDSDYFNKEYSNSSQNIDKRKLRERRKIITKINSLILKACPDGIMTSEKLFNNLNIDELNLLADYYKDLRQFDSENKEKSANTISGTTNIDEEAYNRELEFAKTLTPEQRAVWRKIFIGLNSKGKLIRQYSKVVKNGKVKYKAGKYLPNKYIFNAFIPEDAIKISEEEKAARQFIDDNIEYIPNEEYYKARTKAENNGTLEAWNEANHYFDPITKTIKPLNIWLTREFKEGSKFKNQEEYTVNDNSRKRIKEEYINPDYNVYGDNFNSNNSKYINNNLTDKQIELYNIIETLLNETATTNQMKKFIGQRFVPRQAKYTPDAKWYMKQAFGFVGLELNNKSESSLINELDYNNDFDIKFDMLDTIKTKGYTERLEIPNKLSTETEQEYEDRIKSIKEQNKKIDEENLKLEQEVLDRNWEEVFSNYIKNVAVYNAKQKVKVPIYLALQSLKENKSYQKSAFSGNVIENTNKTELSDNRYATIYQKNTYDVFHNWARRFIFDQFREPTKINKYADLIKNITSAKYMIFNLTGGIANINTGMVNIISEAIAGDYFSKNELQNGIQEYLKNSINFINDMYKDSSTDETVAICKYFDVVDLDAYLEQVNVGDLAEKVKRVKNLLYSLQSGGEHFMQNAVLLTMLKSHKIYKENGKYVIGSLSEYIWNAEVEAMLDILDENTKQQYKLFIKENVEDKKALKNFDEFRKDFNIEFLNTLNNKDLIKKYIEARDQLVKVKKEKFNNEISLLDQFEFKDGYINLKEDAIVTKNQIFEFKNKVITVNKRIHGVYDKLGAAYIEKHWYGNLIMQYHKHLYPGIMKRWRIKGRFNESRGSIERGSYISLAKLLTTEFRKLNLKDNNEINAIESIKSITQAVIDTALNIRFNYKSLSLWEQRNIKRTLGDLSGIVGAILVAMIIHLSTDDDEIKDSETLSTMIYLADRLYSESSAYTPWGFITEASTLYSSPIAATNSIEDLIKGISYINGYLFNEDFNPTYESGLYAGENKILTLIKRNIPAYRVYNRLSNMTRNNQYYRINETAINIKMAKGIADAINPD